MNRPNLEAIEGSDHVTNPVYDKDGWYCQTIGDLIGYARELERRHVTWDQIKAERRIKQLEHALKPFAEIDQTFVIDARDINVTYARRVLQGKS